MYIALAIAVFAFFILTYLNSPVFGGKLNKDDYKDAVNFKDGVFHNQSETPVMLPGTSIWAILKEQLSKPKDNRPGGTIPVVKTDLNNFNPAEPVLIWFGHSSYLLFLKGKKILVDPVFHHVSPVSWFGKPFTMSYNYSVDELPQIDILVITHDHYDHLDYKAFKKLLPKVKHIVTAAGVDAHLKSWGANGTQISALLWNESVQVSECCFTAMPARHFSGRKFKRGETLWSSFVLKTGDVALYLGGDSGFDSHFEKIGEQFGPFDLVILECGQYGKYWPYIHMKPEETIKAGELLKAKTLLPVHWGKFSLSVHSWTEPIERALAASKNTSTPVFTPIIGKPLYFLNDDEVTSAWWKEMKNN